MNLEKGWHHTSDLDMSVSLFQLIKKYIAFNIVVRTRYNCLIKGFFPPILGVFFQTILQVSHQGWLPHTETWIYHGTFNITHIIYFLHQMHAWLAFDLYMMILDPNSRW